MRIGIYGYGNLARGVENAITHNPDMELAAVFTRRDPSSVKIATPGVPVAASDSVLDWIGRIDVMVVCGGSANDLPQMTPVLAEHFHLVDSYDNHPCIPEHYRAVDAASSAAGKLSLISCGWDPGMFSLNRLYSNCILPQGKDYTFWGRGVSQGHTNAIRAVPGVAAGIQYTVPVPDAVRRVRACENPELTTREKHTRECYIVAEEGADQEAIRQQIVTMPDYFDAYDTTVTFITMEEMQRNHTKLPHGGSVIRTGFTGADDEHRQVIEYQLTLESNPEFTGSVLTAFARAVYRMSQRGCVGCKTVFDIAPADLAYADRPWLIAHML